MRVDKKITLPGGTVHFKGDLSDDELDIVIGFGLTLMLSKNLIAYTIVDEDGNAVEEGGSSEPQFLTEDPDHDFDGPEPGDIVH